MTPERELEMLKATAEYCKDKAKYFREQHLFWRETLERTQVRIASLSKQVNRCAS